MKILNYTYKDSCGVAEQIIKEYVHQLSPIIQNVRSVMKQSGDSECAFVTLPESPDTVQQVKNVIAEKMVFKPTVLVVIGIGGSNLGTVAIHELLQGRFFNQEMPPLKVYFADTVDSDYIWDIVRLVEQELEQDNTIILNVVSKSGTTVETVANFDIFLTLLKAYRPVYAPYVVVTTDKNSALWHFAHEEKMTCLEIPKNVGGRFSVFSAVGLFPLGMLGIDIQALADGASAMTKICISDDVQKNVAALSCALLAAQYNDGRRIHDLFLFSVDAQSLGAWYRQLVGESLGKINADKQPVGLVPTVSIGTTDLHSVGQLYLGGDIEMFTTFVSFEKAASELEVQPVSAHMKKLATHLVGKTLPYIMAATLIGVQRAYMLNKKPFDAILFPEKNAFFVGQFMQWKMIETVFLAHLLKVNPFDQPHVELYKKETRNILNHE